MLFLVGLVCAITFYKLGWYQSGNITVAGFVAVFVTVAAYHNRLESRIHRLRLWKGIKAAHLARIRLDWSAIPPRSGESPASHLYAQDLDLIGPHSLTHLLDTTVSDQGGECARLWVSSSRLLRPFGRRVRRSSKSSRRVPYSAIVWCSRPGWQVSRKSTAAAWPPLWKMLRDFPV